MPRIAAVRSVRAVVHDRPALRDSREKQITHAPQDVARIALPLRVGCEHRHPPLLRYSPGELHRNDAQREHRPRGSPRRGNPGAGHRPETPAEPLVGTERAPRIGVVGAGIIGLAVARRLQQLRPDAILTVLEKEHEIALHQTGRNSGVVHAGIYYAPGSLKAELCRRGVGLLRDYCAERGIPTRSAASSSSRWTTPRSRGSSELERRAQANGVPGVRWLDGVSCASSSRTRAGVAGLHSPDDGDHRLPRRCARLPRRRGRRGRRARARRACHGHRTVAGGVRVVAGDEREFDRLVVCAGLQSDRVARLAGDDAEPVDRPVPRRVLPARARAAAARPRAALPGPRSGLPVPRRALHAPRRRRRRRRPERGTRARPRGLPPTRRAARRRRGDAPVDRASAGSRAATGATGSARSAARCRGAPSPPRRAATCRSSRRPTSCAPAPACARRRSTPTGRSSTTSASAGSGR